jgi:hypothetical protein
MTRPENSLREAGQMWESIKRFLFSSKEDSTDSDHLVAVDADLVAEEFDVHSRGAADGRNGVPASDGNGPTLTEVEVTGYFQQEAQAATSFFRNKILDLQKLVKQKSLAKFDNELKAVVPNLKAEIEAVVTTSKAQLIDARRRENELHDEYLAFRRKNKLSRTANYPDSHIFLVAVVLAILIVEAVLNGYFFAKANEFGLVGGVGQALITAGINVAIGWLFGRFLFTQINHCSNGRRLTALIVVPLAFVFVVVFYNLFIGHFRDELASTADAANLVYADVGKDVLRSVLEDPVGLQNFDSWLLVLLGIIFALVAAVDGYFFNDPYPGYGRVAKRYEDARHDYMDDKNDLMDQLADLRDEAIESAESIKSQIESQSNLIQNVVTWSKKREQEAKSYLNDLSMKCNHVLQLYRTSNAQARKDKVPDYFKNKHDLLAEVDSDSIETVDTTGVQEQLSNVDRMLKDAIKVGRDVQKVYTQATDEIAEEIKEIEQT